MGTTINQKAYLQKYLSGPSGDKKKKKKKAIKGSGLKIIDDDIDLSKLRTLEGDELDVFDQGEDAPQIVGIIDDRPEEVRKAEQFSSSTKWKVINQDDGFNSKIQIEEIKKDIKQAEKENELIFGKMYSDSEDDKANDSDLSPPRKQDYEKPKSSKKHDSDSDFSPHRKRDTRSPKRSPDRSPSRKQINRHDSTKRNQDKSIKRRSPNDSDLSPPRKQDTEKRKATKNHGSDSDFSPPRRKSNKSPKRSPDRSPNRRNITRSPSRHDGTKRSNDKSFKRRSPSDSDLSPPRKTFKNNNSDSDFSPPRKRDIRSPRRTHINRHDSTKRSNDKSLKRRSPNQSPKRSYKDNSDKNRKRGNDSPPPSNKKMAKTLEGKMAGLQDARQLRQENETFRKKEDEVFNKMSDEVSGRNAQVVSRKLKRETSEDRQKQKEKADRQRELDEKYKKWTKGIKQLEEQEARVQEFMHESSKPLARLRGDKDLEHSLRQVERDGDPMLQYMRARKRERGELGPEKPVYKGNFPPNRFNIRPGYRWDGVDRSNGYEKKFFEQQSKRKAQEEEAYKWSTEDL